MGMTGDMANIEIETDRWPLFVFRPLALPTDEEVDGYLRALDGNLARCEREQQKTVILIDATHSLGANAQQRRRQADWQLRNAEGCERWVAGYAFAIPSGMVRGMLTAILWLAPLRGGGHVVLPSVEEARAWCDERLGQANGSALAR